jgi:hypothetical protein
MRTNQYLRSIRQFQKENPQLVEEQEAIRRKRIEEYKKLMNENIVVAEGSAAGFPPAPIGGGGDGQTYYFPFYVLPGYVAP